MKDAVTEPNVLTVRQVDGRLEALQSMMQRLEQCQKSLNEYLDQKKDFPRFYFVSKCGLAGHACKNGTNPPRIMKYHSRLLRRLEQANFSS